MAERRPLVVIGGQSKRLPAGDLMPPGPVVPDVFIDGYTVPVTAVTPTAGAITVPLDGRPRTMTLTENTALDATEPAQDASAMLLWVQQDATGGWSLSFPSAWLWSGGTASGIDTTAGALSLVTAINHPTLNKILVSVQSFAVAV